jgi:peptidoglycan/LPS O-acetylase OafA/YrhL
VRAAVVGSRGSAAKLLPLTSLRFVAAAAIVAHHLQGRWVEQGTWLPFVLDQAVGFFFVLSGFILTYVHPELPTRSARLRFLQARIARIWPAHVAALALLLVLLEKHGDFGTGGARAGVALLNVSLLQAWVPIRPVYFSYNDVSWSISTELGFYLLFPWLVQRLRTTWWWKLAGTALLVLALAQLCSSLDLSSNTTAGLVYVHPLARLFEFTLGMCTALLFDRWGPRLAIGTGAATALEAAALVAMLANMRWSARVIYGWQAAGWIGDGLATWLVHGGFCCLSFAAVVLVFAIGRGWLSRLLSLRPLVLLGEISFAMYLLHQILLRGYDQRREALEGVPVGVSLAAFVVVLLVLSHWSWRAIERPLRARIAALGRPAPRTSVGRHDRRGLVAETALVAALLAGLVAVLRQPVSTEPAAEVFAGEPGVEAPLRDVRFGIAAKLHAVRLQPKGRSLELALAWRMVRGLPRDTLIALHVLDAGGQIVAQGDFRTADAREPGESYVDRVRIPWLDPAAVRIGIAVQPPDARALLADRGTRDQDDRRLLIELPPGGR